LLHTSVLTYAHVHNIQPEHLGSQWTIPGSFKLGAANGYNSSCCPTAAVEGSDGFVGHDQRSENQYPLFQMDDGGNS